MSDLFRKKSLERVSSPEQLNDYIRVTTPTVWMVLLALVILLAGMLIWSVLGSVTAQTAEGVTEVIRPITFITN